MKTEAEIDGRSRMADRRSQIADSKWQTREKREGRSVFDLGEVEPWAEAVDGAVLLDEITRLLKRFVVLPKWGAETLALWTVHTYGVELRDVTTYIGIEAPGKRCGETTLLGVLS